MKILSRISSESESMRSLFFTDMEVVVANNSFLIDDDGPWGAAGAVAFHQR